MRLGIDFGTTRIVVAAVDRGNYPVVTFDGPDGEARDWFPPLIAVAGGRRLYGWGAWEAGGKAGTTVVRSIKRVLADAGPETQVVIADQLLPMSRLLAEMMSELHRSLRDASSLDVQVEEPLAAVLGVPANAHGNQRFLTAEAFRTAGFEVLGLLNEPAAAAAEFVHAGGRSPTHGRVLVYDLGGGTFDASLVDVGEAGAEVVATTGIPTLGGDDFDQLLAEQALEAAGLDEVLRDGLEQAETFRLFEECRRRKEAIHPNTRSVVVDLGLVREGWSEVKVPASAFFERCRPALDETMHAVHDVLAERPGEDVEVVYVTGGGSELPLVGRALREVFGRRLRRSPYSRNAVAIGLAIRADAQAGYVLRERFHRSFGVWREADGGRSVWMDELFAPDTVLPGTDEPVLVRARSYRPVHNIGHFRFLECTRCGADGQPAGDVTLWDEIRFPFDPALQDHPDLASVEVVHSDAAPWHEIEERYLVDASGAVSVEIRNRTAGYGRSYRLARWAAAQPQLVPGKRRKTATRAPRARKA